MWQWQNAGGAPDGSTNPPNPNPAAIGPTGHPQGGELQDMLAGMLDHTSTGQVPYEDLMFNSNFE